MLHFSKKAINSVLHQRADSKRSYAARNRCNEAALVSYVFKVGIAAHLAGYRVAVYTYVHQHRAFAYHVSRDKLRLSDCRHNDVGSPQQCRQVACVTMRHRNCSVLVHQQFGDRQPHYVAAPYYHCVLAVKFNESFPDDRLERLHHFAVVDKAHPEHRAAEFYASRSLDNKVVALLSSL